MNRAGAFGFLFLGIVAVALALRCGDLAVRPLHNDEAINAVKLRELWDTGRYRYDPHEYHGPALYYWTLPFLKAASAFRPDQPDEVGMRGTTVAFGLGLLLLTWLWKDGLGRGGALAMAALTAVSPAMVYYSRYYIHEVPLVFFTFLSATALWRYTRRRGWGWATVFGVSVGLMYATKETFILALGAGTVAWVLAMLGDSEVPSQDCEGGSRVGWTAATRRRAWQLIVCVRQVPWSHAMVALLAGLGVVVVFFSSFFDRMGGVMDAVRTYAIWLSRAGTSSPHAHDGMFFLERLGWFHRRGGPYWTEGAIGVLAIIGVWAAVARRDWKPETRFIARAAAWYTVVLAAAYSVIPYKTPWCLLGFLHGALMVAGLGAAAVVTWPARLGLRVGIGLVLAGGVGHLAWQSRQACGEWAADYRNPYVYGHTSSDVTNLLALVRGLAQASGQGDRLPIQVMAPEANYWPLPWYWRKMDRVGWWDRVPEDPYAPVVVAASTLNAGLEERTAQAWWMAGTFELRPRSFVEVYVEKGLWERYLAGRSEAGGETRSSPGD